MIRTSAPKQMVECFGSLATRQFAIDGPRESRQRLPVHRRRFAGDDAARRVAGITQGRLFRSLQSVRRDRGAAGWTAVKDRRRGGPDGAALRIFELDADTTVDTDTLGEMTIAELERLVRKPRNAGALRCSGSFHDARGGERTAA